MQGTWLFFQVTGGSLVAILGLLGYKIALKEKGRRFNKPLDTAAKGRRTISR